MKMKNLLSDNQVEMLNKFVKEQTQIACEMQNTDEPYYGATSGELTYSFTPTSVITVVSL